MPVDKISD